jgi:hypothetical protein
MEGDIECGKYVESMVLGRHCCWRITVGRVFCTVLQGYWGLWVFGISYLAITGEFTLRITVDGYLGGLGRIKMQSDPS